MIQYLTVSDGCKLYTETYGNTLEGIPVLFLHGGPGLGCKDTDKRFFDPDIFHVIFFDQRGAGRTHSVLAENTTANLISDILSILDFYKISKVVLFGGSWGSTLATLFAIEYPERVKAMILRGFFPANQRCIKHFEHGGVGHFFPTAWQRYIEFVPIEERENPTAYYFKMMQNSEEIVSNKYSYEYARYGAAMMKLDATSEDLDTLLATDLDLAKKTLIQAYYSTNNFFIPDEFIYEKLERIKHISTWIVQGQYDMICPPVFAYELHRGLLNSKLKMVIAGHISSEIEIERALKETLVEVDSFWRFETR